MHGLDNELADQLGVPRTVEHVDLGWILQTGQCMDVVYEYRSARRYGRGRA